MLDYLEAWWLEAPRCGFGWSPHWVPNAAEECESITWALGTLGAAHPHLRSPDIANNFWPIVTWIWKVLCWHLGLNTYSPAGRRFRKDVRGFWKWKLLEKEGRWEWALTFYSLAYFLSAVYFLSVVYFLIPDTNRPVPSCSYCHAFPTVMFQGVIRNKPSPFKALDGLLGLFVSFCFLMSALSQQGEK